MAQIEFLKKSIFDSRLEKRWWSSSIRALNFRWNTIKEEPFKKKKKNVWGWQFLRSCWRNNVNNRQIYSSWGFCIVKSAHGHSDGRGKNSNFTMAIGDGNLYCRPPLLRAIKCLLNREVLLLYHFSKLHNLGNGSAAKPITGIFHFNSLRL